ncbi:MAG: DNA-protecting protein DprA [bacterium]|nr:DNA-protecting protein DprA [bacterium]
MKCTKEQFWFGMFQLGLSQTQLSKMNRILEPLEDPFSLGSVWKNIEPLAKKKDRAITLYDLEFAMDEYNDLKARSIEMFYPQHPAYPEILKKRFALPIPLFFQAKGATSLFRQNGVGMVGTRSPSDKGREVILQIAEILVNHGYTIVSGYAAGTDTYSHLASLEKGGSTIAALPCGLREFKKKLELSNYLNKDNFLVLSQFPYTEPWSGVNAMARNSMVIGLSQAVIVIESGAEYTYDHKKSKNRMSGTFVCGKTALNLGVPLLVASPDLVSKDAVGNAKLIQLGGIETDPQDLLIQLEKIGGILYQKPTENQNQDIKVVSTEQLSLDLSDENLVQKTKPKPGKAVKRRRASN